MLFKHYIRILSILVIFKLYLALRNINEEITYVFNLHTSERYVRVCHRGYCIEVLEHVHCGHCLIDRYSNVGKPYFVFREQKEGYGMSLPRKDTVEINSENVLTCEVKMGLSRTCVDFSSRLPLGQMFCPWDRADEKEGAPES